LIVLRNLVGVTALNSTTYLMKFETATLDRRRGSKKRTLWTKEERCSV